METHEPRTCLLGAEAVLHQAIPDFARRTVLRDLFEEVVMRVEEEAETRTKFVDVESAPSRPFDVFHAVIDREREFLQRSGTGFTNVISADRNGVEARRELRTELERVDDESHRRRGRIDVLLLRNIFLQDVVLDRSGNLVPI